MSYSVIQGELDVYWSVYWSTLGQTAVIITVCFYTFFTLLFNASSFLHSVAHVLNSTPDISGINSSGEHKCHIYSFKHGKFHWTVVLTAANLPAVTANSSDTHGVSSHFYSAASQELHQKGLNTRWASNVQMSCLNLTLHISSEHILVLRCSVTPGWQKIVYEVYSSILNSERQMVKTAGDSQLD